MKAFAIQVALISLLILLPVLLPARSAFADGELGADLIGGVENLRNSLAADDPMRETLTLRLADLLFDEATRATAGGNPTAGGTAAQENEAHALRLRSVAAYQEALRGSPTAPAAAVSLKIKFQLARLYSDLNEPEKALPLWQIMAAQDQMPALRREAAIRLAEKAEQDHDYPASERLYSQAITLCDGTDLCSYAHYRRAWILKAQDKLADAVAEIQLALWDARGQVREEALRDLISFLGQKPGDGHAETALVESLIKKIPRPSLLADLSASFFAAGNAPAGVGVLALVDSREPSAKRKIKLLEGYYGLRNWDSFRSTLQALRAMPNAGAPKSDMDSAVESEKILKRLTVQLDGERTSQPRYTRDFEDAVELHLALFPANDALKMMEGWLAAEPDAHHKASMIQSWLAQPAFKLPVSGQIELREARASIGQKLDDGKMVSEEMGALTALTTDAAKKREYEYVNARALYGMKLYGEALPHFVELAKVPAEGAPDHWAILSQNLALDIYGQSKNYAALEAQAVSWTASAAIADLAKKDHALSDELAGMASVAEKARFQAAASGGDTPGSLRIFVEFCLASKLLPQSCENAKVMAVRLKDETALLSVLKTQKAPELAAEEEAAGYFGASAALLEKKLTASSESREKLQKDELPKETLKIALLYEISGNLADGDRILRGLLHSMRSQKSFGELENLLFSTLQDASLLTESELSLAWSAPNRARLAENLAEAGHDDARIQTILMDSDQSTGPKWDALVLAHMNELVAKESTIHFYGARSRTKFTLRIDALKKAVAFADKYLPRATLQARDQMLGTLEKAHADLATEILRTPIPPEVAQAGGDPLKQVQDALTQLAAPFQQKAQAYADILKKDLSQTAAADHVTLSQAAPASAPQAQPSPERALADLHRNPADVNALTALRDSYRARKQERIADYFTGRILQLQNPSSANRSAK